MQRKRVIKYKNEQVGHEKTPDKNEREFVSVVSHQLMTPLALIRGYLSMLLSGKYGEINQTVRLYLNESLGGADRMAQLIKSLLTTSRLENQSVPTDKRVFDIGKIAKKVALDFEQRAKVKNLILASQIDLGIMVEADIDQVREVLSNILDNAVKYTNKGGKIVINCFADLQMAHVSVKDSGIGIKSDNLPHIFDKFYMARLKAQGESFGLGLYIAKMLADLAGGTIKVESKVGRGSTFTFSLPLKQNG